MKSPKNAKELAMWAGRPVELPIPVLQNAVATV